MTNGFENENTTDGQSAEYHLQQAVEHARTTLPMDAACFQKFGKRILSDVQKTYFQNIANGALPTDEEQITFDIESVKLAREAEKRRSPELGDAYEPTLILEDKTTGAVN